MSIVDKDHMTELRSAADARNTAQTAEDDQQLIAVAYAINMASNTGAYDTFFQEPLRANTISKLESKGYTIKTEDKQNQLHRTVISWAE